MASLEGDGVRVSDKFKWELQYLEIQIRDGVWGIVDKSVAPPPSNTNMKAIKNCEKCAKNAISIIARNLADNQFAHIKSCNGLVEAWKTLCIIHEPKTLSNILFVRHKFFTYKMDEGGDVLDHINNIKVFAYQFVCLEAPWQMKMLPWLCLRACTLVRILDHRFWRWCW